MEEQKIERRLKKEIELIGGKALKFVSPGMSGVPDRIVLLPGGKTIFVELKAPNKKLREIQRYRKKQLEKLGFRVECIDSIEKVKDFINSIERR
ncbi:VRR-NUC domain-containing protein [Clostridium baratii]|uniref:VRR-NUC domain-containing protein n=1 Tax=Clostridium baratii TaxID=1561 RepID=UPI0030D006D0